MQSYYIILFVLLLLFIRRRRQKAAAAAIRSFIKRRSIKEMTEMVELAKRFIGKECIVYTFDGSSRFDGIIREVTDGAVLLEKDGKPEAINLDFIVRIREYPKSKGGKKKSLIVD